MDDYGATLRVGAGDAFDIAITTEVGFTATESQALAQGAGMSLNLWISRLESSAGKNFGYSLATTRKQASTYTRRFGNSDERRRDRLIALWRPGVTMRRMQLDQVYVGDAMLPEMLKMVCGPEVSQWWRTTLEVKAYLSPHVEYSDFYAEPS